ncbi:MAG: Rieske 2Fe-2S domain-containing protein [Rhodospirillaceae bacterium]|nr:Rieske 2Fe-2S domain-containing protein [Rhodospirillaceae bacterium]
MSTRQITKRKRQPLEFTLTGPGTIGGKYLRRFWHPIRLSDTLKPGKAVSVRIMSEDFTLYRGETGTPHLVQSKCPHRGTLMSIGTVEGDALRCMYHGWKFAANGACLEQPGEAKSFAHKTGLATYGAQDYLGLIFVYIGEAPAPPLPRYEQLEGNGLLDRSFYIRDCNFFQNLENFVDETHVAFTHRASLFTDLGLNRDVPRIEAEETEYGLIQYGIRGDDNVRASHFIMPNSQLMRLPISASIDGRAQKDTWSDYIAWRVPIDDTVHLSCAVQRLDLDDDATEAFLAKKRAAEEQLARLPDRRQVVAGILRGEIDQATVLDRSDIVLIQDDLTQGGQGTIADRTQEHLGQGDNAIILLRKIWSRELKALAEGRAVKQWSVPSELRTTSGV